MQQVFTNGIRISYSRSGGGKPVLLVMGSSSPGRVWTTHQTPALARAGYESVTFDNRGVPPSDAPPGKYTLDDMVADTKGLIDALDLAPCRIVGTSLGSMIAQELAIQSPGSVRCAVLLGTRGRADAFRRAEVTAQRALIESGVRMPPAYEAFVSVLQMLSPATRNDEEKVERWLDLFELSAPGHTAAGQAWADIVSDRREELRKVSAPCRVISFTDDVITPPALCAEVADAIPDCDLVEIPSCGHLGYLERPQEVNASIIEFLDKH
ncbi:alpha/beta fold hydrolase [Streptomyces cinnamoneus]|uniref:alpha/beta fold hydrolase n=1 Tax=Streptomyces cinnamoneus TaxID=53446 RepID=UPI0037B8F04C